MTRWDRWTTLTALVGLTLMGLLLWVSVVHSAVAKTPRWSCTVRDRMSLPVPGRHRS